MASFVKRTFSVHFSRKAKQRDAPVVVLVPDLLVHGDN